MLHSATLAPQRRGAASAAAPHQPACARPGVPPLPLPPGRRGAHVARFRDATQAREGVEASAPSWRRHFTEAEPPDEGAGISGVVQRAKASMRDSPVKLADLALPAVGALGSVALSEQHDWPAVGVGIAAGAVARLLQQATLEQTVPFTLRRHTLLLPVFAELLLGQFSFAQVLQQPQYRGKALPAEHPDSRLVQRIAERIIGAVEEGHGGGFQKHIPKFDWEVVVLDDPTVNAFVLPGGKIVVFTGLIKLMNRNEDQLATIIGHECAHALARHSSEKLTLGLFIALSVQLALWALQRTLSGGDEQQRQRGPQGYPYGQQQRGGQWGPGGYRGDPRGGPPRGYSRSDPRFDPRLSDPRYSPYGPYARDPYATSRRGRSIYYVLPELGGAEAAAAGPRGLPPSYPGRGGPPGPFGGGGRGGGSPVGGLINIATNLLLQLPFSRRAEAEADLIGLKLMALAGYNPHCAPDTFAKIEEYQARMMGKAAANASYIQDHPRSASRVKLLQEELELMKSMGSKGNEQVLSRVPYWAL